jgi:hypothetical protein
MISPELAEPTLTLVLPPGALRGSRHARSAEIGGRKRNPNPRPDLFQPERDRRDKVGERREIALIDDNGHQL